MTNVLIRRGAVGGGESMEGALWDRQRLEGCRCNPRNAQDWQTPAAGKRQRRVSPTQGARCCQHLNFRLLISRTETMSFYHFELLHLWYFVGGSPGKWNTVWVLPGHLIGSVGLDDSHFRYHLKINFDLFQVPCPGSPWTGFHTPCTGHSYRCAVRKV